jgi:hypothetical protein
MTLQKLASGGVTMVVPELNTQQYFDEAHQWGIKVLPYISLYKVLDSSKGNPLVYLYVVTYAVTDSPSKKTLRVVAGDLKSVIETVEKTIPGATVVGAPVGQPVDAIAANVVPAEV